MLDRLSQVELPVAAGEQMKRVLAKVSHVQQALLQALPVRRQKWTREVRAHVMACRRKQTARMAAGHALLS